MFPSLELHICIWFMSFTDMVWYILFLQHIEEIFKVICIPRQGLISFIHKINAPKNMPQLRICLTFANETNALQGIMIGRQAYIRISILPYSMTSRDGMTNLSDRCLLLELMTYDLDRGAFLNLIGACNCPIGCRTFPCIYKCANLQCIDIWKF